MKVDAGLIPILDVLFLMAVSRQKRSQNSTEIAMNSRVIGMHIEEKKTSVVRRSVGILRSRTPKRDEL